MRIGLSVLTLAAVAAAGQANAEACVEPYGYLVQLSAFETVVRIKPECEQIMAARKAGAPTAQAAGSGPSDGGRQAALSVTEPAAGASEASVQRPVAREERKHAVFGRAVAAASRLVASCDGNPGRVVRVNAYEYRSEVRPECSRKAVLTALATTQRATMSYLADVRSKKSASVALAWVDASGAWGWGAVPADLAEPVTVRRRYQDRNPGRSGQSPGAAQNMREPSPNGEPEGD